MSDFATKNCHGGLKKGSAWHTEGDITSSGIYLFSSQISVSGGFEDFRPRDAGRSGKRTSQNRLRHNCRVKTTHDITYGQGWHALLAGFMGTESTPAEQTASQGDYLTTFDLADDPSIFWTLCYMRDTSSVAMIRSWKISSIEMMLQENGVGTVSFDGIGDLWSDSSSNTAAEIQALTQYNYESAPWGGGANHYYRINTASGAGLSSSDNQDVISVKLSLNRNLKDRFGFRGTNTPYTKEPYQPGDIDGSLTVKYLGTTYDAYTDYVSKPYKKAEIFFDGSVIGTTINRSEKMQFPYMQADGAIPRGYDMPNNASLVDPEITYTLLKGTAPTGMTGVTDYYRHTSIGPTRSTKWTA